MTPLEFVALIVVAIVVFNVSVACWLLWLYRVENRKPSRVREISPDAGGLL